MKSYNAIGLMSGSSLDGLDIAYCQINEDNGNWSYKILLSQCLPYPHKWKLRLKNLVLQDAITYLKTDVFYGHFIGELVRKFITENNLQGKVDFIASHGHTIFHQPENKMTSQIGDGAAIAAECGIPVVCNFRTMDVALGGQGAPIVPIGDKLFFPDYNFCLNLGGISNISFKVNAEKIIAYDISLVNLILNLLAEQLHLDFDEDGKNASVGILNKELLQELNACWYYLKEYPRTLGGGFVGRVIMPIINKYKISVQDKLRTYCEHIAIQIKNEIEKIYAREGVEKNPNHTMLVTGGGAFNIFLMEKIKEHVPVKVLLPNEETIKFKEALIITLMGVLRVRNEINCLSSVTGASMDSIGGEIYEVAGSKVLGG